MYMLKKGAMKIHRQTTEISMTYLWNLVQTEMIFSFFVNMSRWCCRNRRKSTCMIGIVTNPLETVLRPTWKASVSQVLFFESRKPLLCRPCKGNCGHYWNRRRRWEQKILHRESSVEILSVWKWLFFKRQRDPSAARSFSKKWVNLSSESKTIRVQFFVFMGRPEITEWVTHSSRDLLTQAGLDLPTPLSIRIFRQNLLEWGAVTSPQ